MKNSIEFKDKHPLNTSKSKQAHVFSKSPRFRQPQQPMSRTTFYNLTSSDVRLNPKKISSFKFNKQHRFLDEQKRKRQIILTPSPQSYNKPSFTEVSLKKKKGVSFNHSPKAKDRIEYLPGPATYTPQKCNPEHARSAFLTLEKRKNQNHWNKIGPGNYNVQKDLRLSVNGKIGKASRFNYKLREQPGPASYHRERKFNEDSYIYEKSPKYSFAKSPKNRQKVGRNSQSPGPGSYNNSFSEFSERSKRIFEILNRL